MIETKILPIGLLEKNKGQIEGVPANPRRVQKDRMEALRRSIVDHPDMLHLRELLVIDNGKRYVILGGNMRYEACKELGYTEIPCKIIPKDTDPYDLRALVVKDNVSIGTDDHDLLANEWDEVELIKFGMEIPVIEEETVEIEEEKLSTPKLIVQAADHSDLKDLFIELQAKGFVCELK